MTPPERVVAALREAGPRGAPVAGAGHGRFEAARAGRMPRMEERWAAITR